MNQNKSFDFSQPNRQSRVAILLVVLKTTKTIFRQFVLPIIIFFLLGRKSSNYGMYFVYFILALSIWSMVYSIINFFKSYFYIQGKELIVHTGFISKKQLSIPFERIQNINFEQNIIHQIFGVKRVKIDTAGSAEKEFEFAAIENERADALRDLLIINKTKSLTPTVNEPYNAATSDDKTILHLSLFNLIKAGLYENHLKSSFLIFVAAWYLYTNAQEIGVDAEDYLDKLPPIAYGLYLALSVAILFSFVSVLISLVRTVLKHFNLKFVRIENGFKIEQGLFNTVTVSALDYKIQTMSWSDSLLQRVAGIFEIKLKQAKASSTGTNTKESITIPGASKNHIAEVQSYIFPHQNIDQIEMKNVDIAYRNRRLAIIGTLPVLAIGIAIYFGNWNGVLLFLVLLLCLPIFIFLEYKKLSYGYNDEIIRIKGGTFGEKNNVTFIHKLQSIKKSESPFQRKRGLVTLTLKNASDALTIPYINQTEAMAIMDVFLKKVETDKRNWL